jgi:hypothetical protein
MTAPRFFTDEDVYPHIAEELTRSGFDAVSAQAAGRLHEDDPSQLFWAASQSRSLVSFNVRDYARIHTEWMQQNLEHAGIIVSAQVDIGLLRRRLIRLAKTISAEELQNQLIYLGTYFSQSNPGIDDSN